MEAAGPDELRILQINIGSLLEPGWDERRHELVAWIDELRPDVVAMEEVWASATQDDTASWVADRVADDYHVHFDGFEIPPSFQPDPTLRFGSAVLSRWPIDESRLWRLPVVDDGGFATHIGWELLWVRTAELDVFATHLAPAPTDLHHRRLQVQAIEDHVAEVRGDRDAFVRFGQGRTAMPAILCGDFNAEPDSDEIRWLSGLTMLDGRHTFWQDAWRVAGDHGPGLTQDWRTNPTAASLNVHRKRIDYVFVGDAFQRAGDAGRVLDCRVVGTESLTGGPLISDHAGVLATIRWPSRPA